MAGLSMGEKGDATQTARVLPQLRPAPYGALVKVSTESSRPRADLALRINGLYGERNSISCRLLGTRFVVKTASTKRSES